MKFLWNWDGAILRGPYSGLSENGFVYGNDSRFIVNDNSIINTVEKQFIIMYV